MGVAGLVLAQPARGLPLVAAVLAGMLACRPPERAPAPAPDDEIVAALDGQPVRASEVALHLRPAPPRVGAGPAVDPRRAALDDAVRVRLLGREARRRGLAAIDGPPAVVQASLVRALVDAESARRGVPAAGAIADADAERFYQEHQHRLSTPASVTVAAVVVAEAALAERLLQEADRVDDAGFARLVAAHSIDAPSRSRGGLLAVVQEHEHQLERPLLQVAWQLRRPGMVGLAAGSDGRWYVLRAREVMLAPQPWPAVATKVRNLMVWERRNQVMAELVERLRGGASLTVDEAALGRVDVPSPP